MVGIVSEHEYRFATSRGDVWAALTRVDRYCEWWPWLRGFDGSAFAAGEQWRCAVRPPLPYTLRFTIELTNVVVGEHVDARLDGDIAGAAELALRETNGGCVLRLAADLTAVRGVAGFVDRVLPPLARWGHDWVLDNGARQFRDAALAG